MIYEKMLEQNKSLEKQIETAQKQLATCPPGKLVCAKNGKIFRGFAATSLRESRALYIMTNLRLYFC